MKKLDLTSVKYNRLQSLKRKCKCGHSEYVVNKSKKICSWCGHYIYESPFEEFKDRLTSAMIKNRKEVLR